MAAGRDVSLSVYVLQAIFQGMQNDRRVLPGCKAWLLPQRSLVMWGNGLFSSGKGEPAGLGL